MLKDKVSNAKYTPMFVLESETNPLQYHDNLISIWMDENSDLENFKKSYEIEITNINYQSSKGTKGVQIKVIDNDCLILKEGFRGKYQKSFDGS